MVHIIFVLDSADLEINVGLKLNIQKRKIMASGPITSWEIDGETVETVSDFIFGGSKITADGDCRHEIKRCLLLGRKVMTNLDSILKIRDITLPTKVRLVKAMVFLVVMYGCESWTVKKAERWRIDAFELWCWRRLLRVPWTARRSNQQIIKEISPEYWLERLVLKLKLQYFGHLMGRVDSFEKTLMLGKIEGRRKGDDRGWDGWMASPTQWTWVWVNSGSWWWTGRPGMLRFMRSQWVGHDWVTELNWCREIWMAVIFCQIFCFKVYLGHTLQCVRILYRGLCFCDFTEQCCFEYSICISSPGCQEASAKAAMT